MVNIVLYEASEDNNHYSVVSVSALVLEVGDKDTELGTSSVLRLCSNSHKFKHLTLPSAAA